MNDAKIPRRHFYKVYNWVKEGEHPRRRMRLTEDDLHDVDFAVFGVWLEGKPTDVSYVTVYGPIDDWETLEGILAYDFGEEGSLIFAAA